MTTGMSSKATPTWVAAAMVRVQVGAVPALAQAPVQFASLEPAAGVAVRVREVPSSSSALQVPEVTAAEAVQLRPPVVEEMDPAPWPLADKVRASMTGAGGSLLPPQPVADTSTPRRTILRMHRPWME